MKGFFFFFCLSNKRMKLVYLTYKRMKVFYPSKQKKKGFLSNQQKVFYLSNNRKKVSFCLSNKRIIVFYQRNKIINVFLSKSWKIKKCFISTIKEKMFYLSSARVNGGLLSDLQNKNNCPQEKGSIHFKYLMTCCTAATCLPQELCPAVVVSLETGQPVENARDDDAGCSVYWYTWIVHCLLQARWQSG